MTDKIILTDCDGVLCDWSLAFDQWISQHGYEKIVHDMPDLLQFHMFRANPNYHVQFFHIHAKTFNESAWIDELEELRDATTGVKRLVDAGYKFVIISALSDLEQPKHARQRNLHSLFGEDFMIELICVSEMTSKKPIIEDCMKRYPSAICWIEDNAKNANMGAELGIDTFLIDHEYNKKGVDNRIKRVYNMNSIADILLTTEN